jgi:hypothetical protein
MRRLLAAVVFLTLGCASSMRHVGYVSLVTAHSTLSAIQDTERVLVCGRPLAPQAPNCITLDKHHEISEMLVTAFDLEEKVRLLVRALPDGAEQPADVATIIAQINGLVETVLLSLPKTQRVDNLKKNLGVQ